MTKYTPDRWVIVKATFEEEVCYKVLAGWIGSYATADSWKLSSGTVEVEESEDRLYLPQHSGSVYICHKSREGLSSLTSEMLYSWRELAAKQGAPDAIKVITFDDFVKEWYA